MTDNGNQPRPVRTLTVKNFSVIKEAKLEFGKITVLIGPQSSGKSLLCKLAYFLGKEVLELAVDRILGNSSLEEFRSLVIARFLNRFLTGQQWVMPYSSELLDGDYSIKIFGKSATPGGHDGDIGCLFSDEFDALYRSLLSEQSVEGRISGKSRQDQLDEIWTRLNLSLVAPFVRESLYIPAGRAFFTDAQKGFSAVQNAGLDPIILRFAPEIVWNTRWKVGMVTAGDGVLEEIRQMMVRIGKGEVIVSGDQALFRRPDGTLLPLSLLSSGTQELLPLFNVLFRLASYQEEREVLRSAHQHDRPSVGSKQLIYVEEPEANVFPSTQYELVRLFSQLSHEPNLDFSWVITTHSPYILSSFNNLIEAGQAAHNNPKLRSKIAKIVPEKYWIKGGDFAAYSIEDGKLKSILNESGFVEANYLDQVSEAIGDEFDKLLRLEYERTKVS
jgi:hypothetical protein